MEKAVQSLGRLAVTGAGGFVGAQLIDAALRRGEVVRALTTGGCKRQDVEVCVLNFGDVSELEHALADVDCLIHVAGRAHNLGENEADPEVRQLHWQANVESTGQLATAAKRAGVRRFVFVSTIGVHGEPHTGHPFSSGDRPAPHGPYAESKWAAEQVLAERLRDSATDFVILRPPLVYGPGCPGNFAQLLRLVDKLPVIPLGGLRAPRTFIGVHNLVDALLVAAACPKVSGKTYVVADAEDISVGQVVRWLAEGLNKSPWRVWNIPADMLAVAARLTGKSAAWNKLSSALQVDAGDFENDTGWSQPVPVHEGLLETARHYAANCDQRSSMQ